MAKELPAWVKPGGWGVAIGAIGFAVIGFNANLMMTAGDARNVAYTQSEKAVVDALTPICLAQFGGVPQADRMTHLAALKKEEFWERSKYVEKQGWATMPGAKHPNDDVAIACAKELMKVSQTPDGKTSG